MREEEHRTTTQRMGLPWFRARIWAHKSSGAFSGGGGAFGGGGGGGDGGDVVGLWDDSMAGREGKEGVNERSHLGIYLNGPSTKGNN